MYLMFFWRKWKLIVRVILCVANKIHVLRWKCENKVYEENLLLFWVGVDVASFRESQSQAAKALNISPTQKLCALNFTLNEAFKL